jgi:MFS family permease
VSSAPRSEALPATVGSMFSPAYRNYVLVVLLIAYVVNVMDRAVLGVLLESIKNEFHASDTALGLLSGPAFALFYATLGIPIAYWADRTVRRNILAAAVALWSVATALCGLAPSFPLLLLARIGTGVGEAGGTPPSNSLIADYFRLEGRATALSVYALGVPLGGMLGSSLGGWGNELLGWRETFVLMGLPGIVVALLVRFTVREPVRGCSDTRVTAAASAAAPQFLTSLRFLWSRRSFRNLSLAAALHSAVWYAGSSFNANILIRSHHMTSGQAGSWLAALAAIGTAGTFLGGYLADRMSVQRNDRRWYMWLPAWATLLAVPFQFVAYLAPGRGVVFAAFSIMTVLASFFFGPSFAMTQGLATLRMRTMAAAILLFIQNIIGLGFGPLFTGILSDRLKPALGSESLRWAIVVVGLLNIWAAAHYFWAARTLREDLTATERLA